MKTLLLAGFGHSHLFVLEALSRRPLADVAVCLVAPPDYHYSGMMPGVVAGCYRLDEARLDPAGACRAAGVEWIPGCVTAIDARSRTLVVDGSRRLGYDALSLDIGARAAADDLPGVRDHATLTKPVARVVELRDRLERVLRREPDGPARAVIVGGEAAGIEVALCLDAYLAARFGRDRYRISVLERGPVILQSYNARARHLALELLAERGIRVRTRTTIVSVGDREAIDDFGGVHRHDALLWATGPRAPGLLRGSGLALDDAGYLQVFATLQSTSHAEVFGAGDCATIRGGEWVPRSGVFAVRQGPVLAANLRRFLSGHRLAAYQPQRHWLSLLNTGTGSALLAWRGLAARGKALWWLKDRIDRKFIDRFRDIGA
jgi:selenide, water dikinase